MCTTNIYTYVHPDGYHERVQEPPVLCQAAAPYGQPCLNNVAFQHPPQMVAAPYLPPTPQYSTSPSTPNYRSGDDSDRSRGSSSSNKKRSSGIYYNGHKVLPMNRREGSRREGSRRERIVVVENPPTSRTPPQTWTAPHTAPSSPNGNTYVIETSPRDSHRRQPVIVDERNRSDRHVQIEIVDSNTKRHRSQSHSRHTSTSSSYSDEEEKRRRRQHREKKREEEEMRDQRVRARIAQANAEINSRPAVPMAPAPKRASTYKRPAVEVHDTHADLVEAVRRLELEDARREEKARIQEEEAQRQRLKERMMPNRRASVGPGSRRHRVQYEDGLYRWE